MLTQMHMWQCCYDSALFLISPRSLSMARARFIWRDLRRSRPRNAFHVARRNATAATPIYAPYRLWYDPIRDLCARHVRSLARISVHRCAVAMPAREPCAEPPAHPHAGRGAQYFELSIVTRNRDYDSTIAFRTSNGKYFSHQTNAKLFINFKEFHIVII